MSGLIECQQNLLALANDKGYLTFDDILEAAEQKVYAIRRGRNAHVHGVPKNATPKEYAKATGAPTDASSAAWNWTWQRDTAYKTYQGFWNGYRGVAPCIQIQIPAA